MQDTHLEICSWLQTLDAALLGGLRLKLQKQSNNTRCGGPPNTLFSGSVETLFYKELRRLAAGGHTAGLPPASEPKTSYIIYMKSRKPPSPCAAAARSRGKSAACARSIAALSL